MPCYSSVPVAAAESARSSSETARGLPCEGESAAAGEAQSRARQAQQVRRIWLKRRGAAMSKGAGVVLILCGLAVAAYVISAEDAGNGQDAARQAEVANDVAQKVVKSPAANVAPDPAVPRPRPAP